MILYGQLCKQRKLNIKKELLNNIKTNQNFSKIKDEIYEEFLQIF